MPRKGKGGAATRPSSEKKDANSNLVEARKNKNDEFYTQLADIEKELAHYKGHFRGKTVFCNCDDPVWSSFWKYFTLNFVHLGLRKVISTHYEKGARSYKLEFSGDGAIVKTALNGDGDFRSDECVAILKEADIVVTNPPFSLFREYVGQLVEHGKKFLVVGSQNAISYKDVFALLKDGRVWLGNTNPKRFARADGTIQTFGNISWFTNLPHAKRNEHLILYRTHKGNEADYPKYDNCAAINVDKVKDIPCDYDGVMGVPITFLDKFNPEQFEILGIANSARWIGYECLTLLDKKKIYNRLMIRRRAGRED